MGKLEQKYRDELVVIGVQSPKYPAESVPANLEHAVHRLGIQHPVVEDAEYRIWQAYAVSAWPTLVFISPQGEVIGQHAGEAPFVALDRALEGLVAGYDQAGVLDRTPIDLGVHPWSRPMTELAFPGSVLPTPDIIFIADSDHHRILLTDRTGRVQQIVGSGQPGLQDGVGFEARFYQPQGMALDGNTRTLYVADSENHAIRAVQLETGMVRTIAGTGQQAYRVQRRGPALDTDLSSPWDVALDGDTLYIAMAGTHQIWALNLAQGLVEVWAGTGHEAIRDGARLNAWFAQPMGLSLHSGQLYVSCAESQAIRRIDVASGEVFTMVGGGLFDFGDEDGSAERARLQHNQGIAATDMAIYIADTYNNKIRQLDLATSQVSTLAGSALPGDRDGERSAARFNEPAHLTLLGTTLYIADTNNHAVRTLNTETGVVATLRIDGIGSI